jgi:phosphate transport system protein
MAEQRRFDREIGSALEKLTKMSYLAEEAIDQTMEALKTRDKALAQKVIEGDQEIDRLDKEIEDQSFRILLLDQPVAGDFLRISSALKMITDLERIGDYAVDIAEEIVAFPDEPYIKEIIHLPLMGQYVIAMVHKAVRDFVNEDVASARTLARDDDKVDDLFLSIKKELIVLIKQKQENADQAIIFMMIAKYLERIGDHAVNIGEWVDYSLTGTHSMS